MTIFWNEKSPSTASSSTDQSVSEMAWRISSSSWATGLSSQTQSSGTAMPGVLLKLDRQCGVDDDFLVFDEEEAVRMPHRLALQLDRNQDQRRAQRLVADRVVPIEKTSGKVKDPQRLVLKFGVGAPRQVVENLPDAFRIVEVGDDVFGSRRFLL